MGRKKERKYVAGMETNRKPKCPTDENNQYCRLQIKFILRFENGYFWYLLLIKAAGVDNDEGGCESTFTWCDQIGRHAFPFRGMCTGHCNWHTVFTILNCNVLYKL